MNKKYLICFLDFIYLDLQGASWPYIYCLCFLPNFNLNGA